MRSFVRIFLAVSSLSVWGVALGYWSDLPSKIPMHFGLNGQPDQFAEKSITSWFWLPTLASVFACGFGLLLPKWVRSMAASNSALLNVPDQRRFRALPTDARLRVIDAMMEPMLWMAVVLQWLFAWIVYSTAKVALEDWQRLPMWPTITAIALVVGCAARLLVTATKAVASEVAQHPE